MSDSYVGSVLLAEVAPLTIATRFRVVAIRSNISIERGAVEVRLNANKSLLHNSSEIADQGHAMRRAAPTLLLSPG
jgi:hypothetical protein